MVVMVMMPTLMIMTIMMMTMTMMLQWLVTQLDNLCIDHWVFVLIILSRHPEIRKRQNAVMHYLRAGGKRRWWFLVHLSKIFFVLCFYVCKSITYSQRCILVKAIVRLISFTNI